VAKRKASGAPFGKLVYMPAQADVYIVRTNEAGAENSRVGPSGFPVPYVCHALCSAQVLFLSQTHNSFSLHSPSHAPSHMHTRTLTYHMQVSFHRWLQSFGGGGPFGPPTPELIARMGPRLSREQLLDRCAAGPHTHTHTQHVNGEEGRGGNGCVQFIRS
jgi:hypothetical protein